VSLTASDRHEIVELQSFYAWGIDGKDPSQFALAFTDDITTSYSTLGRMEGLDVFTKWVTAFHAPFDATQHVISNHHVSADGADVAYRSYFIATILCKGTQGGDIFNAGGYYVDHVVRTDAGWRIRSREATSMWQTGNRLVLDVGKQAIASLGSPFTRL
jgi:hypothetical protein